LIGYASPSNAQQWFTPTEAGTWDVVIFAVDGTQYNQSGDPTLPDVAEQVDPGPIQYFWPVLANTSDQWEPGMSWTNGADASQGPTNAYGTLNIDTPTNGQPFALAGIGYDAYGNKVDSGAATASVTCTAASGGTCPGLPGSVSGSYANTGGFTAGQYTLNFTPTGSPYPAGVSSSPTTTAITFSLLGLRGWNVQVGDGSTTLGSGGPGSTIALGTLPSGVKTLNFSIEGLDQNNNVFTGYTNNGTDQEGVICVSATNGGVCPGGSAGSSNVWLSNPIALGSSGSPDGYTGWSNLTTFQPGTYTLPIWAGQYGDAGGQNWVPTWNNTDVTFNIPIPPKINDVIVSWHEFQYGYNNQYLGWSPFFDIQGSGLNVATTDNNAYDLDLSSNSGGPNDGQSLTSESTLNAIEYPNVLPGYTYAGGDTPWLTIFRPYLYIGGTGNLNTMEYVSWDSTAITVFWSPYVAEGSQFNYGHHWGIEVVNQQSQEAYCEIDLPTGFYSKYYENPYYSATLACSDGTP
jgi:hypothetical protein